MFEKIKAFFKRRKKKKEEPAETPAETVVLTFEDPKPAEEVPAEEPKPAEETVPENIPAEETCAAEAPAETENPEEEDDVPSGRFTPEYMEFLEKLDREKAELPEETEENKGIDAPVIRQ